MMSDAIPTVLTIAGTDPTGGAGIIADVKTISALGGYALSVPTAVVAQNSRAVKTIHPLPVGLIIDQLQSVIEEFPVSAVKIGMIPSGDIARSIAPFLAKLGDNVPVVLDPVLRASSGKGLCEAAMVDVLSNEILPYTDLVTPNLSEAAQFLHSSPADTRHDMLQQAGFLNERLKSNVLLKGGHLRDKTHSPDLLMMLDGSSHWFESARINTPHGRGTGCTLSSALAVFMIHYPLIEAIHCAKAYLHSTLKGAAALKLVPERGPLAHFVEHRDR